MLGSDEASANLLEYSRALRTEIIEAQKLRGQVGRQDGFPRNAPGVFFKDAKGDLSILICPVCCAMFDCMVYGLSFNIRDVGSYIGEHLGPQMGEVHVHVLYKQAEIPANTVIPAFAVSVT